VHDCDHCVIKIESITKCSYCSCVSACTKQEVKHENEPKLQILIKYEFSTFHCIFFKDFQWLSLKVNNYIKFEHSDSARYLFHSVNCCWFCCTVPQCVVTLAICYLMLPDCFIFCCMNCWSDETSGTTVGAGTFIHQVLWDTEMHLPMMRMLVNETCCKSVLNLMECDVVSCNETCKFRAPLIVNFGQFFNRGV